jgi:hypothetical protein
MTKKSDSKWLSLATAPILGQPISAKRKLTNNKVLVLLPTIGHCVKAGCLFIVSNLLRGNVA